MKIDAYLLKQLLPLAGAIWVLGKMLKNAKFVKDEYIPLILLPFGILGSFGLLIILENATMADWTTAVIQGILATGVAVYTNQVPKQLNKINKYDARA